MPDDGAADGSSRGKQSSTRTPLFRSCIAANGTRVPSATTSRYEILDSALQASSLVLLDGIPRPRI